MEVGGRRENPATAGFEDGGTGLEPRNEDVFGGLESARKWILPSELPKRNGVL